jgi:zinc transport system ATP-binding protein
MKFLPLQVSHLFFRYSEREEWTLKDITFQVKENEFVAIIGPNGGGKTTLIKLILGFLKPTKGEIKLFGEEPQKGNYRVGYVAQHTTFSLDIPLSVIDIVLQGRLGKWKLFPSKTDRHRAMEILEKLKIAHLANRLISELSGGERQKVLIARALAVEPDLLIMDEPTSAIDMEGQKEILDLIESIKITRLVVSHDIKILMRQVDKIIYIHKTAVIHDGPKLEIPKETHFCEVELINFLQNTSNLETSTEEVGSEN